MSGMPKAPSAAEPEIEETTPIDEADEASPPLDLDLDDAQAEPGPIARGAAVIKSFWQHAPLGPGVYRMIGDDGEVLYVGKARSIKKRILELHDAGAAVDPHRPHDLADRLDGVRHHRERGRGAAARGQSHQAAEAALQRARCATTRASPIS